MHPQELSIELPSQGARRATEEGSQNGCQKPQRFSARQKSEVVLRLLRGEPLDLLSRELGIPAARLTSWREAFLDAGQEAMKKTPRDSRDRELGRLREKLGEATMEMELSEKGTTREKLIVDLFYKMTMEPAPLPILAYFRDLSLEEFQQFRSQVEPLSEEKISEEIRKAEAEFERKAKENPGRNPPPPGSTIRV